MKRAIDITDADDICCKECSGVYFRQLIRLKKVSALVSPTGRDLVIPIKIVKCDRCGHIDESVLAGSE